jgi:2-polyprenyl-6-methoxyphenol hydroxylase-like FAD-dependent oxidoreductase
VLVRFTHSSHWTTTAALLLLLSACDGGSVVFAVAAAALLWLRLLTGQGVNSALEDVCVLERHLLTAHGDLSEALPAFEQQRLPDSAALAKLVQVKFAFPNMTVSCCHI